ncbi:GPW/gp25 family protein [Paenibacillus sp. FSL K6-1330]|uniref:GPW/gp25 family protein n=1 Tax=Paenibacillus sp. FSL K6-1330 TaxID=2975292 RepID=UPI0030D71EB4
MIVDFAPKTLADELNQNITCIIETVVGSVPLFRDFGIDQIDVDAPANMVQSQLTNKIISAIQEYEPRVVVDSVTYDINENGEVKPNVIYSIAEEAMT